MRLPRPRWTLRRRLVFGIVALLAAVSVVVGTVSVLTLNDSLVTKLDDQVTSASSRFQNIAEGPGGGRPPGGAGAIAPFAGLPPGTVAGTVTDGEATAYVLGDQLQVTPLTDEQNADLADLAVYDTPVTIDLGGDLGEYRFMLTESATGEDVLIGMSLAEVHSTVNQVLLVVALVTLAGLIAAFAAGTAIVRVALRPLERVAATAAHVSELPLERGEVALAVRVPDEDADPRTEVGQVGAAINRMLGHISSALTAREASERKVRTFVADASHELRTPLASIRGYAELTRRGGHELPADVVHALGRVESESIRMTSLVEDLLLLARLDDGRSLESIAVDLSQLMTDAVSDAYAAGPDHEWILELPDAAVVVAGDSARLHQVVTNLLANARVHTPAGTRVVASVVLNGSTAEVRISDNGPGIDERVRESAFERFARGDSSRSRAAGSTGLGLAIVAAIVEAHGGTVAVQSEPGSTVFTVALPLTAD
ncbi:two-component system OmpR family sensor kinase [Conyzicola lurida]|uniref:histidine kinase n=1 Tax=Conyzicola lurida TaxID=1172621 RepID=A0A841ARW1_9MICO|nr:HAMP domain-containing sensor histidine kinase [Conyzicola lurida]MBB5844511.1 two-component system OmpR family sensor kinase [Conyzicola lurida]